MDIKIILENKLYDFPISYSNDYYTQIHLLLDSYKKDISKIDILNLVDLKTLKEDVKKICDYIDLGIRKYLDGFSYESHSILFKVFDMLKIYLLNDIYISSIPLKLNGLYKIRNIKKKEDSLSCYENFILPFNLNYKIGNNRFSIPGFPCLYLGTSSYVCIHEVGKKKNQVISRYEYWDNNELNKIIYLFYRPYQINEIINENKYLELIPKFIDSYLRILPLLLVIYHCVQKKTGLFKPEYIVGQILMQWIRLNDIDGICYLSTNINYDIIDIPLALNFAFPAQPTRKDSFDAKFCLSKPVILSRNLLNSLYKNNNIQQLEYIDDCGRGTIIIPKRQLNGKNYWNTYYGRIDHLLQYARHYYPSDSNFCNKSDIKKYEFQAKPSFYDL